jgi:hypothetical protein
MQRGTPQAGEQKNDRYHQKAVNLAFAELRIKWHSEAHSLNETCPDPGCKRSRSAAPEMAL